MPEWRRALREILTFASLPLMRASRRARVLYEVAGDVNQFTEHSLYLNLGFWKDRPRSLDAACEAMARLLGEESLMDSTDRVLDVGFGFGDQDLYWMSQYHPRLMVGVNITPAQVRIARSRAKSSSLGSLHFMVGSATALPFAERAFTKVLALESGHHFVTRDAFFSEAFRVLQPRGRLAAAEALALEGDGVHETWRDKLSARERHFFAAWPRHNWYTRQTYQSKLESAGFVGVQVRSVREHVYPQLMRFLASRLDEPDLRIRVNPLHRRRWLRNVRSESYRQATLRNFDYVIAVADKPGALER